MDVHDKETRSYNMARIRSANTKPELAVVDVCRSVRDTTGQRFYINVKRLPGKPDVVFPRAKLAIFVNGCFWHSHSCRYGRVTPKTNFEFWAAKRAATVTRDEQKMLQLVKLGYNVRVIWECEAKNGLELTPLITEWLTQAAPS